MNIMKRIIAVMLLLCIPMVFAGCGQEGDADPNAIYIEIKCQSADVYQIFYSSYIDGQYYGMGAAADQDGRRINSDMVLKTVLTKSYFEDSDVSLLSMDFSPYGENESYEMGTTNQVAIKAEYGKTYTVLISGNRESGFTAALEEGNADQ